MYESTDSGYTWVNKTQITTIADDHVNLALFKKGKLIC